MAKLSRLITNMGDERWQKCCRMSAYGIWLSNHGLFKSAGLDLVEERFNVDYVGNKDD